MKKIICAILLIVSIVMVGCSSKTADIRKITISTSPVSSVTPNNPTDDNSNNKNPNKATADVNGYKKLNLTSITMKVVGSNAENFYKWAKLTLLYFILKDGKDGESVIKLECSNFARNNADCIIESRKGVLGSVKLEDDQSLLYSKMFLDGSCGKNYLKNESIVAPIEKLSDTKCRAFFRLVLEDNVRIRVACEFDVEFVESL